MNISFYVLSENKAQDFLGFICQLTQTALNKSTQSVLILIEDEALLASLDASLWAQEATSFIPHQRIDDSDTVTRPDATSSSMNDKTSAPVLLGNHMPADFKGIVLNTTAHPVNQFMAATHNAHPTRVLELIKPDSSSVDAGRHKYKNYQQSGYELTHFKV